MNENTPSPEQVIADALWKVFDCPSSQEFGDLINILLNQHKIDFALQILLIQQLYAISNDLSDINASIADLQDCIQRSQ